MNRHACLERNGISEFVDNTSNIGVTDYPRKCRQLLEFQGSTHGCLHHNGVNNPNNHINSSNSSLAFQLKNDRSILAPINHLNHSLPPAYDEVTPTSVPTNCDFSSGHTEAKKIFEKFQNGGLTDEDILKITGLTSTPISSRTGDLKCQYHTDCCKNSVKFANGNLIIENVNGINGEDESEDDIEFVNSENSSSADDLPDLSAKSTKNIVRVTNPETNNENGYYCYNCYYNTYKNGGSSHHRDSSDSGSSSSSGFLTISRHPSVDLNRQTSCSTINGDCLVLTPPRSATISLGAKDYYERTYIPASHCFSNNYRLSTRNHSKTISTISASRLTRCKTSTISRPYACCADASCGIASKDGIINKGCFFINNNNHNNSNNNIYATMPVLGRSPKERNDSSFIDKNYHYELRPNPFAIASNDNSPHHISASCSDLVWLKSDLDHNSNNNLKANNNNNTCTTNSLTNVTSTLSKSIPPLSENTAVSNIPLTPKSWALKLSLNLCFQSENFKSFAALISEYKKSITSTTQQTSPSTEPLKVLPGPNSIATPKTNKQPLSLPSDNLTPSGKLTAVLPPGTPSPTRKFNTSSSSKTRNFDSSNEMVKPPSEYRNAGFDSTTGYTDSNSKTYHLVSNADKVDHNRCLTGECAHSPKTGFRTFALPERACQYINGGVAKGTALYRNLHDAVSTTARRIESTDGYRSAREFTRARPQITFLGSVIALFTVLPLVSFLSFVIGSFCFTFFGFLLIEGTLLSIASIAAFAIIGVLASMGLALGVFLLTTYMVATRFLGFARSTLIPTSKQKAETLYHTFRSSVGNIGTRLCAEGSTCPLSSHFKAAFSGSTSQNGAGSASRHAPQQQQRSNGLSDHKSNYGTVASSLVNSAFRDGDVSNTSLYHRHQHSPTTAPRDVGDDTKF